VVRGPINWLASLCNRLRPVATPGWQGIDSRQTMPGLEVLVDPNPDYDASDEIEYFFNALGWGLRGVYPPPSYPPV